MRQINIPKTLKILHSANELTDELAGLINAETCIVYSSSAKTLAQAIISRFDIKHQIFSAGKAFTQTDLDLLEFPKSLNFIGIGGGTVLDIAKYLASKNNGHFISVPTLVSHDGICSPVAVINGKSIGATMPTAILVPLDLVKKADIKYIYAGIGDLISNLSAIDDWQLAAQAGKDEVDDFSFMLSKTAALSLIKTLELGSSQGLKFLYTDEFLTVLVESLNLAGIAMSIAGSSRPCSGAEHMISHAIDQIYGAGVKSQHGIQVGIATLYLAQYRKDFPDLKGLLKTIGFPTSFNEIGISDRELLKVLKLAPSTRAGRYTVFENPILETN